MPDLISTETGLVIAALAVAGLLWWTWPGYTAALHQLERWVDRVLGRGPDDRE